MFTLLLLNGPKVVLKRVTCSLVSIQGMHPNKEVKLSGFLLKPEAAPALCCSNEKPLTNISGQGSCGEQPPPNVQHTEGSSCECPHLIDAVWERGGFSTGCPSADGLFISLSQLFNKSPAHTSPNLMIRARIGWMI